MGKDLSSSELIAEAVVPAPKAGSTLRGDIVRLVRDRRYEDALALLYQARGEDPQNRELQASIQQIKEFLIGAYAKRLGGLDHVAGPIPVAAGRSPEALLVARYIDGTATFDDITRTCPLGQLRTLQILASLYRNGESIPPPREASAPKLRRIDGPAEENEEDRLTTPAPPSAEHRVTVPAPPMAPELTPDPPAAMMAELTASPPFAIEDARERVSVMTPPPGVAALFARAAPEPEESALATFERAAPEESPDARFHAAFSRGTQAFVQRRYVDAVDAFTECQRLRPDHAPSAMLLRRALRDHQSS